MEDKIDQIYNLASRCWFDVADNNMLACGHPGVTGCAGGDINTMYSGESKLISAIEVLTQVHNKLKNGV